MSHLENPEDANEQLLSKPQLTVFPRVNCRRRSDKAHVSTARPLQRLVPMRAMSEGQLKLRHVALCNHRSAICNLQAPQIVDRC